MRTSPPRAGHNSVQVPHNGVLADREICFRRMERELARRERGRLIRKGIIIPAFRMPPQMMVKNPDGSWSPEIKTYAR